MGANAKNLLIHLRERQERLGVNAFHFHHVLRNTKLEPAAYPVTAQTIIDLGPDAKNWTEEKNISSNDLRKDPEEIPINVEQKVVGLKSNRKRKAGEMSADINYDQGKTVTEFKIKPLLLSPAKVEIGSAPNPDNLKAFANPPPPPPNHPSHYMPYHNYPMAMQHHPSYHQYPWAHFPVGYAGAIGPHTSFDGLNADSRLPIPPPAPYPFGSNSQYYQHNSVTPSSVPNQQIMNGDPSFHNIDPALLPPGPPIFGGIPQPSSGFKAADSQAPISNSTPKAPYVTLMPPSWTPSTASPSKKKARGKKKEIEVETPSRSNRTRRPTRKLIESAEQ